MTETTPITVAYGDGIGPEIMAATLNIIKAAGARIEPEWVEAVAGDRGSRDYFEPRWDAAKMTPPSRRGFGGMPA